MLKQHIKASDLNALGTQAMLAHIGIEITELGKDFIAGKMPVDHRTIQPFGILHGGASVVLAETLGSYGSYCCIDIEKQYCVGLEINANHVRAVKEGFVYGMAKLLHFGRKTHIWDIQITNERQQLVCISRLTIAVLDKEE